METVNHLFQNMIGPGSQNLSAGEQTEQSLWMFAARFPVE